MTLKGGKLKASQGRAKRSKQQATPPPEAASDSDVESSGEEGVDSADKNGLEDGGDDDYKSNDDEDDGVDEVGMERLMKALGDDGLDEFEQAQLKALGGKVEELEMDGDDSDESEADEEGSEQEQDEVEDKGGEDEEVVALDDVESVDEDAVPRQKIVINNEDALERIRESIQLDPSLPWTETLVVSYPESIAVDVDDDLNRELAFYKQALHAANTARSLAAKHSLPFTRPSDYFAEMVKSDSHMERIRQRLLDEKAGIKKSEDKRKEREGKKFGKQVQLEKLKEREKGKKDMEERLKSLKRKRKDMLDNPQDDGDAFDVAVEDAIGDRPSASKRGRGSGRGAKMPRDARDKKFGFSGAGRRSKSNTKASTEDFDSHGKGSFRGGSRGGRGGSGGRGGREGRGGGTKRLGKSRRMASRGK